MCVCVCEDYRSRNKVKASHDLQKMIIILDQGSLGEEERLGILVESKEINVLQTQEMSK